MKSKVLLSVLSVLMVVGNAVGMDTAPVPTKYLSKDLSEEAQGEAWAFFKSRSESQLKEILEWVAPVIKAGNPENLELSKLVSGLFMWYPVAQQVLLEAYLTGKNERAYLNLAFLMVDVPENVTGNLLKQAHGNLLKEEIEQGIQDGYGNYMPMYQSMVSLLAKYRPQETLEAVIKTLPLWTQESLRFIVKGNPAAWQALVEADLASKNECDYKKILSSRRNLQVNKCIFENLHKVNPRLLYLIDIDQLTPEQKKILADFEKEQWQGAGYRDIFGVHSLVTPTAAHLKNITLQGAAGESERDRKALGTLLFYEDMSIYRDDDRFKDLVKKVHDIQEQGYKDGYYTYIHAHTWPLDFDQCVYAALHPERLGKDFFPLHFLTLTKREAFPVQIAGAKVSEDECIKILLDKGSDASVNYERYLLSINASFLGNLTQLGESTAAYLATSRSISPPKSAFIEVFEDDDTSDIYSKYKTQFDSLAKLHTSCSQYGKLWIIMVPKEQNKYLVIPASGSKVIGFGKKIPLSVNGKFTYDVDVIQEALYQGGQLIDNIDTIQFRLLMTPKTGLNPNLGIKTIPISLADPKCYAEFNIQFKKLMEQVKADIAAKQKAMPRAKL